MKSKHAVYVPHTAGRYAQKRFRKAQCPIVERSVPRTWRFPAVLVIFLRTQERRGSAGENGLTGSVALVTCVCLRGRCALPDRATRS